MLLMFCIFQMAKEKKVNSISSEATEGFRQHLAALKASEFLLLYLPFIFHISKFQSKQKGISLMRQLSGLSQNCRRLSKKRLVKHLRFLSTLLISSILNYMPFYSRTLTPAWSSWISWKWNMISAVPPVSIFFRWIPCFFDIRMLL